MKVREPNCFYLTAIKIQVILLFPKNICFHFNVPKEDDSVKNTTFKSPSMPAEVFCVFWAVPFTNNISYLDCRLEKDDAIE